MASAAIILMMKLVDRPVSRKCTSCARLFSMSLLVSMMNLRSMTLSHGHELVLHVGSDTRHQMNPVFEKHVKELG